jgi:hypothetical protein
MSTKIIFIVDPSTLINSTGTYDAPVGVGHPPILVSKDHATPTSHSGEYQVPVNQTEQVQIWLEDSGRRPNILMAPVRLIANTWNGQNLTLDTVNGPDTPIGRPDYMETHADAYSFVYAGSQPDWETDNNADFNTYFKGVDAGRDGKPVTPRTYNPYVTFEMGSETGVLQYGLEFLLLVDGKSKGYFWFDPYIKVI